MLTMLILYLDGTTVKPQKKNAVSTTGRSGSMICSSMATRSPSLGIIQTTTTLITNGWTSTLMGSSGTTATATATAPARCATAAG